MKKRYKITTLLTLLACVSSLHAGESTIGRNLTHNGDFSQGKFYFQSQVFNRHIPENHKKLNGVIGVGTAMDIFRGKKGREANSGPYLVTFYLNSLLHKRDKPVTIWSQTVDAEFNRDYIWSMDTITINNANLEFFVNGKLLDNLSLSPYERSSNNRWEKVNLRYANNEEHTRLTLEIKIRNGQHSGTLGLDNIQFRENITTQQSECEVKYKKNILHFADEDDVNGNRLITIDYNKMKVLSKEYIKGSLNHHADPMGTLTGANYMLLIPKGSNYVNVHDIKTGKHLKNIRLPFRPRSADAYNAKYNLVFLNSRNRPAGVLIDASSAKLVGKVGFNIQCSQTGANPLSIKKVYAKNEILNPNYTCTHVDFGGDQISGHPIWLSFDTLALLDRANRMIHIYKIRKNGSLWSTKLIQTLTTETSMHQLIPHNATNPDNRVFYGMTEGNKNTNTPARIYKYKLIGSKLLELSNVTMEYGAYDGYQGHNLYITPDRKYLYAPLGKTTFEREESTGRVFIVSTKTMRIEKSIRAGKGAGHVAFSKQRHLAVITNHTDSFLTIIDSRRQEFKKNIRLPFQHTGLFGLNLSHMQHISLDGKYYYNFWTAVGHFFRVDLDRLQVDKILKVNGTPIQGNFYKNVAINCNLPSLDADDGYDNLFTNREVVFTTTEETTTTLSAPANSPRSRRVKERIESNNNGYTPKDSSESASDSNGYNK